MKYLLLGVVFGVITGVQLMDQMELKHFNVVIGALVVGFVVSQVVKEKIFKSEKPFVPSHGTEDAVCGIGAGLTSTFAHGAGTMVNIFMIPQLLPKEKFVSTRVLLFIWINWIKMPFFLGWGLVTLKSPQWNAMYLPLIPVGVMLGVKLNQKIPEEKFRTLVYIPTLLAGLYLIISNLSL